jgi:hypothetical protein
MPQSGWRVAINFPDLRIKTPVRLISKFEHKLLKSALQTSGGFGLFLVNEKAAR